MTDLVGGGKTLRPDYEIDIEREITIDPDKLYRLNAAVGLSGLGPNTVKSILHKHCFHRRSAMQASRNEHFDIKGEIVLKLMEVKPIAQEIISKARKDNIIIRERKAYILAADHIFAKSESSAEEEP